ncbi:MAG: T9SS type A sorting domain-containing protein [Bacteroidetes bacterium]|nr:T9SS type A sorting domain-containing protein [Bacteroidota bacterium]
MKLRTSILFFAACLCLSSRAFGQSGPDQQQTTPAAPQGDSTSGWKIVYTYPYLPAGYTLGGLQFPSKDTGYVFGWNGANAVLLRSTDQGLTWDSLPTPLPGDIVFVSSLVGYACAHDPNDKTVWKTIDGGMSWQSFNRASVASGPMTFACVDTGVVFGFAKNVRTSDGGKTWNEVNAAIGLAPNAGCFGDKLTGYAVGAMTPYPEHFDWPDAGYCEKSTDGGLTWKQVYTGISHEIWCCKAIGTDLIFVGGNAFVARSTDGGANWGDLNQSIGLAEAISFSSIQHGIVVGTDGNSHGMILMTNDTGRTWQPSYLPNAPALFGIACLNDSVALICGDGIIYRTTTGGLPSGVQQPPTIDLGVQVYPNPTPGASTIQYTLPSATSVSFRFTDARGVIVSITAPQLQDAGMHTQMFDGSQLPNGVYYFTLSTTQGIATGSITVQR